MLRKTSVVGEDKNAPEGQVGEEADSMSEAFRVAALMVTKAIIEESLNESEGDRCFRVDGQYRTWPVVTWRTLRKAVVVVSE